MYIFVDYPLTKKHLHIVIEIRYNKELNNEIKNFFNYLQTGT